MSSTLQEFDTTSEIVLLSKADVVIADMKKKYLPLTIEGVEDKMGEAAVHKARMIVRGTRVDVKTRGKKMRAGATQYSRKVIAEENRLVVELETIEADLLEKEDVVKAERVRIKQEEEEAAAKVAQDRVDALSAVGYMIQYVEAALISDDAYDTLLATKTEAYVAEQKRLKQEAAEKAAIKEEENKARVEAEKKLAYDRAELEKKKRLQQEEADQAAATLKEQQDELAEQQRLWQVEADQIAAEKQKIVDAENERNRQAELEQARKEAAEKARVEEAARIEREKTEAAKEAKAAELEGQRVEALKPVREKLTAWVDAHEMPLPDVAITAQFHGELMSVRDKAIENMHLVIQSHMDRS